MFEIKLTTRSKSQKVLINRCRLFNHLEDVKNTAISEEEESEIEPKLQQQGNRHVRFNDDDDDDDEEVGGPNLVQIQAPAPAPLPAQLLPHPLEDLIVWQLT